MTYGTRIERAAKTKSKPVYCVELNRVFDSATIASKELSIDNSSIGKACKGILNTAGGYHWQYVE